MAQEQSYSTQLIDHDGVFNVDGVENFIKSTNFSSCGNSYAVVAIMGPQSSGKSTLLNHLFRTNFREMNTNGRRIQTTKGIWTENCAGIEPFTIAMDLEGTDGRERGENLRSSLKSKRSNNSKLFRLIQRATLTILCFPAHHGQRP